MPMTHMVVHQLTRTREKTDLHLNDDELSIDDACKGLLMEVKGSFSGRASKRYGGFSQEAGHFKALVKQWLSESISFKTLGQQLLERLALHLEQQELESDGHWLLAEEEVESGRLLWLFQMRHKEGLAVTHNLQLSGSRILDFGRLGFGVCLDLTAFAANEGQYLTVSFGFGDKALQDGLMDFTDFVATVDASADTEAFVQVVDAFTQQLPPEKGQNYRKKALEFCVEQDKLGEPISVRTLSEELQADAEASIVDYIEQKAPEVKSEFIADRKSLKKYIRYSGKSKDVSISFSNDTLGRDIQFDAENNRLIINEIPSALLKQLKGQKD